MTIRGLSPIRHPASIVLVGASTRPASVGAVILDNLTSQGFEGAIYAVNPHPGSRPGVTWFGSVKELPSAPDLAILATPPETIPGLIDQLGALGTRCAVVISAGIRNISGLEQRMLDAARRHAVRIIGPNCLGLIFPHAKLNAAFARVPAQAGGLALLSQSGALVTAILDWAQARDIGFSGIVSAGDMADVDLGDLIDFFAVDPLTEAILLYVEGISDARKFLSAARAAALSKPVIAIKAGKSPEAAKATWSHTGALAGSYDVYRAAFARSGVVLVDSLPELFDAAQILRLYGQARGERLGIVTNGGGAGILAVDALKSAGAKPAALDPATVSALDARLPGNWSGANPVDIIGDAGPGRYRDAVRAVLRDPAVDALLVINCPTGMSEAADLAGAVVSEVEAARAEHLRKPVLACWLGDRNGDAVRAIFGEAGIPVYTTPEEAVRGFGYLVAARKAQHDLTDAPVAFVDPKPDLKTARQIVDQVRADRRTQMTEVEAKALLAACGIPVVQTRLAADVAAVRQACASLTAPYAVKIISPDFTHKSDVGGVALGLCDSLAAEEAAAAMETAIRRDHPHARITGYTVEEMVERPKAYEMIVGIADDATFGPVLMAGAGGTAVEIIGDKALALPPIDHAQALALIDKTRISRLLAGYRNVPPARRDAVAGVLDSLSRMTIDLPDIVELDINPLLVDADGAIALDARIRISAEAQAGSRLAIRPAPTCWSGELVTREGMKLFVRPVRPDDEARLAAFFEHVTPEDLRFRFLTGAPHVSHEQLAMMTRVDYRRTMTFLAFDREGGAVVATAMLAADADRARGEVALATRSDMKGKGISWTLLEHLLRYAKAEGIGTIEAIESADHDAALRMEREMGFEVSIDPDDPGIRVLRRSLAARSTG